MYEASEKVIKTIRRKMWKIGAGYVERDATMIVTPRVVVCVVFCAAEINIRYHVVKCEFFLFKRMKCENTLTVLRLKAPNWKIRAKWVLD